MRSPFEMAELTESEEKIAQLTHESELLTADYDDVEDSV
jgi:hypothetical protein